MTSVPSECRELEEEVDELTALKRALEEAVGSGGGGGGHGSGDGGGHGSGGAGGGGGHGGGGPDDGVVRPLGGDTGTGPDDERISIQHDHSDVDQRLEEVSRELRERETALDACIERHTDDVPEQASEAIEERRRTLEKAGRRLGDPDGPVERIDHGGSVRHFEEGRIYYHPNTGANEVRGGILQKYLDVGGPDRHPDTGFREFKFPTTGEIRSEDERYPVSHFEGGSIYWVRGTHGGVAVFGPTYEHWKEQGRERGPLGYPLVDTHERADGWVTYFERGCLWTPSRDGDWDGGGGGGDGGGGGGGGDPDDGVIHPQGGAESEVDDAPIGVLGGGNGTIVAFEFHGGPLDGSQTVVDPAGDDRLFARSIRVKATDELAGTVDDLGTDLWDDRLVLTPSDDGLDATPVPLVAHPRGSYVRIAPDEREALVEGAAYDVSMRLLDGSLRRLFSRAVLAQTDPETRRSDIRFGDREMELIGSVDVTASTREDPTVRLDPAEGFVTVGGEEREGTLRVLDDDGRERIRIDGETGDVHLALDGMGASPESLAERIQEVERRLEELEAE